MKLKKLVPILLVISLFTGCSYKTNYKSDFNNNSSLNKNYKINGNIENNIQQGFFRSIIHNRVVLYINNKLVIKTPLNDDYSGRTELYYESKPLLVHLVVLLLYHVDEMVSLLKYLLLFLELIY